MRPDRPAPRSRAGAALTVPLGQLFFALSGFVVLVLAGRTGPPAAFATVTSFYFLLNTVGRGMFSAVEMELTRTVAAARAEGTSVRRVCAQSVPATLVLLAGSVVLVVVSLPLLAEIVRGDAGVVALLLAGAVGIAMSSFVRGPLAALGRHRAYSASFGIEGAVNVGGSLALAAAEVQAPSAWVSLFVLGPVAATGLVAATFRPRPCPRALVADVRTAVGALARRAGPPASTAVSTLLWSSVLLLASQGVWNLAAVLATTRLIERPEVAAGFAATAVLVRAPVLAFPAVQALVLPAASAEAARGERALAGRAERRGASMLSGAARRWWPLMAAAAGAWIVVALVLVPPVTRTLFSVGDTPPRFVLLTLALASVLGAAVVLPQIQLVALGRQRRVALAWLTGLAVLMVVGLAPGDPRFAASAAQVLAVAVAGAVMLSAALPEREPRPADLSLVSSRRGPGRRPGRAGGHR